MSLEHCLGPLDLTDIPQGRPGRRPGWPGEGRGSPPDYYIIIYEHNARSADRAPRPGIRLSTREWGSPRIRKMTLYLEAA